MREALAKSGWDHGLISVHDKMLKLGMQALSVVVLARIFRKRGLIVPIPRKCPRFSYRSFRYPMPNAYWQLDATEYVFEGGRKCVIFQLLNEHSRVAVASLAATKTENGADAVKDFRAGIAVRCSGFSATTATY